MQTLETRTSKATTLSKVSVKKLEALTSLRFFAAVMILILHVAGTFDFLLTSQLNGLGLWQGVSFFFVLSGFILTYVHPHLADVSAVNNFFVARFARIWPTYFVAFCLYVALLPECLHKPDAGLFAILNLFMIQSWTLNKAAIKAFNTPGWSISTEFFFYLYFPILLNSFQSQWRKKLLFTFSLVILSLAATALAIWPGFMPTVYLEVNINPLCRLFEFSLGMATCLAYRNYADKLPWSKATTTALEIVAIAGIGGCLLLPRLMPVMENHQWLNPLRVWIDFCGAGPAYAFLIFLFALERGALAQLMTKRLFVGLGEISFSLYMFHLPILMYFQEHLDKQKDGSLIPAIVAAIIIAGALSRINFLLVEIPCRKAILDLAKKFGDRSTGKTSASPECLHPQSSQPASNLPRPRLLEVAAWVLLIAATCAVMQWQDRHFRFINEKTVEANMLLSQPQFRNVTFGDAFALRGISLRPHSNGLQLTAVWQSLKDQLLDYNNGLHLLDASGNLLSCQDYSQDQACRRVRKGQFWLDKIELPSDQLKNVSTIGLVIYHANPLHILGIANGAVDRTGTKLLIPLTSKTAM